MGTIQNNFIMDKETIIEGNRLIAIFDGVTFSKSGKTCRRNGSTFKSSALQYHSSFDWIVPVVIKIYRLDLDCFEMRCLEHQSLISSNQSIFKQVVAFVKYYNGLTEYNSNTPKQ